jgi:hypothetical protein
MLRKEILLSCFGLLFLVSAQAQFYDSKKFKDRMEFGGFLGFSNYQGDLEEKPANLEQTGLGVGVFTQYEATSHIGLRLGVDYCSISDEDINSTASYRRQRNLSFRTPIFDVQLMPVLKLFKARVSRHHYLSASVFAGIGVFHFNPMAEYKGKWYDLQPLGTEGQGLPEYPYNKPYALTQVYYPFGFGFKYDIDRRWELGVDFRFNKTFTDYLDDVSGRYADPEIIRAHRGDVAAALSDRSGEVLVNSRPHTNQERGEVTNTDWFFLSGFTLTYHFAKFSCDKF